MLCFSFCGWMHFFHFGVVKYLSTHYDCSKFVFAGSSAGSFIAMCLCVGIPIKKGLYESTHNLKLYKKNPFKICSYFYESLYRIMPIDAYKKCNHRLYISLTTYSNYSFQNNIISTYTSKNDVVHAIIASCYIPPFAGIYLYQSKYLDGGLTCRLLNIHKYETIKISASGLSY